MSLTETDRRLIQRCLDRDQDAWTDFVDRFVGVIYHAVHHAAQMRSVVLQPDEVDDLAAEVVTQILEDNFKVLRRFRGRSSLATYLTVIARRVVVTRLYRRQAMERRKATFDKAALATQDPDLRIDTEEEVHQLLAGLREREADLVRSFYLERKPYQQISQEMGIPENSIGPMLARLRQRLREQAASNAR